LAWTSLAPHCVWRSAGVASEQTTIYQDTPHGVRQVLTMTAKAPRPKDERLSGMGI